MLTVDNPYLTLNLELYCHCFKSGQVMDENLRGVFIALFEQVLVTEPLINKAGILSQLLELRSRWFQEDVIALLDSVPGSLLRASTLFIFMRENAIFLPTPLARDLYSRLLRDLHREKQFLAFKTVLQMLNRDSRMVDFQLEVDTIIPLQVSRSGETN